MITFAAPEAILRCNVSALEPDDASFQPLNFWQSKRLEAAFTGYSNRNGAIEFFKKCFFLAQYCSE